MLELRVFGDAEQMREVAARVGDLGGVRHVTCSETGDGRGGALVTAEVGAQNADATLRWLSARGIPADDVWLLRLEGLQPGRPPEPDVSHVVWADLLGLASQHARPVARYLVFMAVAGVIAAYGVIYRNGILIVGAMAVSPDFLPVAALCIALASRRGVLAGRAFMTLAEGLVAAGLIAALLTALLDLVGILPSTFQVGQGALIGLTKIDSSTIVVAFVAGIAGLLALETRASAAVGVAISVTTIPASAYLGVAAGVGEFEKAEGALLLLAVNVAMLLLGGTLTLLVQQRLAPREAERSSPSGDDSPPAVPGTSSDHARSRGGHA